MPHTPLHRQKFKANMAVLFALIAWVALIWGVAMVKMAPANEIKSHYDVPAQYKVCAKDSDCSVISTTCNGCCESEGINTLYTAAFGKERDKYCSGYKGPVCDCCVRDQTASCVQGACMESKAEPCQ